MIWFIGPWTLVVAWLGWLAGRRSRWEEHTGQAPAPVIPPEVPKDGRMEAVPLVDEVDPR